VLVERNPDQHIGDAFGCRPRVAQSGGVAIKVAFVHQFAVTGDQHAANLLELSGTNRSVKRVQAGFGKTAFSRSGRGPGADRLRS
jgi:hypothetical protein